MITKLTAFKHINRIDLIIFQGLSLILFFKISLYDSKSRNYIFIVEGSPAGQFTWISIHRMHQSGATSKLKSFERSSRDRVTSFDHFIVFFKVKIQWGQYCLKLRQLREISAMIAIGAEIF